MNITEDYVSFEVAKLLKKKGFDEPIWTRYEDNNEIIFGDKYNWNNRPMGQISAPSQAMAMKWLREKKYISIVIDDEIPLLYKYIIKKYSENKEYSINKDYRICVYKEESMPFVKYEQAVEAALKYSLENLI